MPEALGAMGAMPVAQRGHAVERVRFFEWTWPLVGGHATQATPALCLRLDQTVVWTARRKTAQRSESRCPMPICNSSPA